MGVARLSGSPPEGILVEQYWPYWLAGASAVVWLGLWAYLIVLDRRVRGLEAARDLEEGR